MAHAIERAPTGRAKCRGCGASIAKGEWRVGERVPNPFADGEGAETTHWYHPPCAAYKRPEAFLAALETTPVPLDREESLVAAARLGVAHHRVPRVDAAGRAPTGRAACRACKTPIEKDSWRIGLVFYEDGRFAPSGFIHARCAGEYLGTKDLADRIRHFSPALGETDIDEIQRQL